MEDLKMVLCDLTTKKFVHDVLSANGQSKNVMEL